MSKRFFRESGQYQAPYPPSGQGYPGQQRYSGQPYGQPGCENQQPYTAPQSRRGGAPGAGKSSFWSFCFAFIPGAGQMYLGYMKRGLSLIALFCLGFVLVDLLTVMAVLLPIVWMYSFFDTFNLRSQLIAGTAPADDYVLHLGRNKRLEQLLAKRHTLVGWVLICLGAWAIFQNFLLSPLYALCERFGLYWLYNMLRNLPALLLMVAMILVGVWLVRGPQGGTAAPDEEFAPYTPGGPAPAAAPETPPEPVPGPSRDLFDLSENAPAAPEPPTEE